MRLLIVTSVAAEAEAIGSIDDNLLCIVGGIGRTNAAAATTEAILSSGPYDAIINAGIAGALPHGNLSIGEAIVASRCIYCEEGLLTPRGFQSMADLGFPLGDFPGNSVPVDQSLLEILQEEFRSGPIATVATCSGTGSAANEVARRTGALAEAMEGAAVVHAARRLGVAAIELRIISNTTGDRDAQQWDLPLALERLGEAVRCATARLRREVG